MADEGSEQVVGCGSCDERSTHGEGANVDGIHHEGGCSLEEVGHGRSSPRMEGSRCCDGRVVESASDSGRCGELRPGSGKMSKRSQACVLVGDIHQLCSERWHL